MEQPRRLTLTERALGLALLAAVALIGFLESRSPMAEAARAHKPWLFFLALDSSPIQGPPNLFLGIYDSSRPVVHLVYLPGDTPVSGARTLDEAYRRTFSRSGIPELAEKAEARAASAWLSEIPALASANPSFIRGPAAPSDLPPIEARDWIRRPLKNVLLLPIFIKTLRASIIRKNQDDGANSSAEPPSLSGLDRFFLALRLAQIPKDDAVPAWLPDRQDVRSDFFGRLVSGREPPQHAGPVTVEIENAAGISGLAFDATKILRSRGADVVSESNAPEESGQTVIYDRTGRIENARAVSRMLSCPSAEVMTRVDPSRLVDVSVILARDCSHAAKETSAWSSSKS
ncbi:MAG TPA: LytR C-terminal domain-containing protein [Elusimicrobiota bacterium]|nr:LytR C-terminal domain-containing protein [Elusimicrobiota bacterium]